MPNIVDNYLRATPYVGTGGLIDPTGMPILKGLGFKTVVNLNTADEGATAEAALAEQAGFAYINIAVPTKAPTAEQVAEFAKIVEDPANYPILVHCESSNRVGALWALYRASTGVPPMVAVEEGRAVGLKTSREALPYANSLVCPSALNPGWGPISRSLPLVPPPALVEPEMSGRRRDPVVHS
ncbi:MAG: protein tyrosine phosphatase family protein [Rhodobacteraceae bacterium]|nr:protein tyrosine phosphatase family protein [Paracoccaceae bacterium]